MLNYQTGDILNFAYEGGVFTWLERLGNHIHYTEPVRKDWIHSAFVVQTDKNGVLVSEANGEKITNSYYPQEYLDKKFSEGFLSIGETVLPLDPWKVKCFAKLHLFDPYSYMNLSDLAIYWVTGRTNVRKTDNWICSEYVAAMILFASSFRLNVVKDLKLPADDYCAPMDLAIWNKIFWRGQCCSTIGG